MYKKLQEQIINIVKENQPVLISDIFKSIYISSKEIEDEITNLCDKKILQLRQGYIYIHDNNMNIQSVEDCMTIARTIKDDVSIISAITTMILEELDFLIIANDMNLVGILSKKDIIKKVILEKIDVTTSVSEIMTKKPNIIYAKNTEKLALVIEKLIQNDIDSIPIVKIENNEDGQEILKVIGVFNKTIITKIYKDLHTN